MKKSLANKIPYLIPILLSLTPLYGIAYLALIFTTARHVKFSKTFSSLVSRLVLSAMLLAATIMIVGIGAWLVQAQVYPLAVVITGLAMAALLSRYQTVKPTQSRVVDRGDIVSVCLAVVAPVIIVASFQLPNPSYAGLYQYLNKGWDNSNHLLMLTTAQLENGYVYGGYKDLKKKTISTFNAYPQAWHLATAHIANGFVFDVFNPDNQLSQIVSYSAVLFLWYAVVVYIFSRVCWRLLISISPSQADSTPAVCLFAIANLVIQLIVFWGSLNAGFINYLACIAYILILVAIIIDKEDRNQSSSYLVALIVTTAAALCWFLPLPALGLALFLGFLYKPMGSFSQLLIYLRSLALLPTTVTILAMLAVGTQLYVFITYNGVGGGEQLNTGRLAGAFIMSHLLLLVMVAVSLVYWFTTRLTKINSLHSKLIASVAPFIILVSAMYAYQLFTTNELSYYFGKSMGILFAVVGIFFVPAFVALLRRLRFNELGSFAVVVIGASIAGLLIVGTNQTIAGFKGLFQRSSTVSPETAEAVIKYVAQEDPEKTRLVVLRDVRVEEDYNGNLASKLAHTPLTCAYAVVNLESSQSVDLKLQNLDSCAGELNKDIFVITSNRTQAQVKRLQAVHDNIRIVHVP